jgi:hypothetical protein
MRGLSLLSSLQAKILARNTLGVIYAEEGRTARAWLVWRELVRDMPDYDPSRTNLALPGSQNEVVPDETEAVVPPPAASVKAIEDERKPPSPIGETEIVLVPAQQVDGE